MKETLTMSYQETERLKVISRVEHKELTVVEAAESLSLSERHLYRILHRYRDEGEVGLIHRLRGRPSNVAFEAETRKQVLRLYRERYSDYGPTLFAEKLESVHEITISRQAITRWLAQASLWAGTRKKRPHRKKRTRRTCIGSLVQFDGSDHDWFEGRGHKCCLLVAIDDASNRTFVRFAPAEDTISVLLFWWQYVEQFGMPAEVYTDFGSVYHDNSGNQRLTQYGRAMTALGIKLIYAHSPQAKGRVERANRTLQDRLIKALREQNISTIENANRFLKETFLNDYNKRFAHPDSLTDIHRSARGIDLNNMFCFEETRHVYNDWTITLDAQFIQLLQSEAPLPPPRSKVILRQWLDGSLHIFWNEHELKYDRLDKKPKSVTLVPRRPAADHPWRKKRVGKLNTNSKMKMKRHLVSDNKALYPHMPTGKSSAPKRRKDSTRSARSVFPSRNTSP